MPQVKIILEPIGLTCVEVGLITRDVDVLAVAISVSVYTSINVDCCASQNERIY